MDFSNFPTSIGKPEQIVNYTYDQHIIKPPDKNQTHGRITQHVVINSSDRDTDKYPNPNDYVIEFKSTLDQTIGMTLTKFVIPKSAYAVNVNNSSIHFKEVDGSNILIAVMKSGNYNITQLLAEIGKSMSVVSASNGTGTKYSAEVDEVTRKITIRFIPGTGFEKLELITGCLKKSPTVPCVSDQQKKCIKQDKLCQSEAFECGTDYNHLNGGLYYSTLMPKSAGKVTGFGKGVYCSSEADAIAQLSVSADFVDDAVVTFDTVEGNINKDFWYSSGGGVDFVYTKFRFDDDTGKVECVPDTTATVMESLEIEGTSNNKIKAYLNGGGISSSTGLIHQMTDKYVVTPYNHSGIPKEYIFGQASYTKTGGTITVPNTDNVSKGLYDAIGDGTINDGDNLGFAYLSSDGDIKITVKEIENLDAVARTFDILGGEELYHLIDGSCLLVAYYEDGDNDDYYQLLLTGSVESVVGATKFTTNGVTELSIYDKIDVQYWKSDECKVVCEERQVLNLSGEGDQTVIVSGEFPEDISTVVYSVVDSDAVCAIMCSGTGNTVIGNCPYYLDGESYLLLKLNDEIGSEGKFEGMNDAALGTFDVTLLEGVTWKNCYQNYGDQYVTGARKLYNPPRDKMNRLRVSFYTIDGELYDFNCRDHMFCLELEILNQPKHYADTAM